MECVVKGSQERDLGDDARETNKYGREKLCFINSMALSRHNKKISLLKCSFLLLTEDAR